MFLKFRYRLGYELLCCEVADSISWQRFCRIPLGTRVPHPTTLMKIASRCGDEAVAGLNAALVRMAFGLVLSSPVDVATHPVDLQSERKAHQVVLSVLGAGAGALLASCFVQS